MGHDGSVHVSAWWVLSPTKPSLRTCQVDAIGQLGAQRGEELVRELRAPVVQRVALQGCVTCPLQNPAHHLRGLLCAAAAFFGACMAELKRSDVWYVEAALGMEISPMRLGSYTLLDSKVAVGPSINVLAP